MKTEDIKNVAGESTPATKKRPKPYLPDHVLYAELERCWEQGKATDKLAEMFMLMATKIQSQFRYEDDQDREDCYWGAVGTCIRVWMKFDMTKTRPFPFFTRVIYNGLYAAWNELAKHRADVSTDMIFLESV